MKVVLIDFGGDWTVCGILGLGFGFDLNVCWNLSGFVMPFCVRFGLQWVQVCVLVFDLTLNFGLLGCVLLIYLCDWIVALVSRCRLCICG